MGLWPWRIRAMFTMFCMFSTNGVHGRRTNFEFIKMTVSLPEEAVEKLQQRATRSGWGSKVRRRQGHSDDAGVGRSPDRRDGRHGENFTLHPRQWPLRMASRRRKTIRPPPQT